MNFRISICSGRQELSDCQNLGNWHHNFFAHKKLLTQNTEEELTGHKISGRTTTTGAPSNASSCKCGVKETSKIVGGQETIVSFAFPMLSLYYIYFEIFSLVDGHGLLFSVLVQPMAPEW